MAATRTGTVGVAPGTVAGIGVVAVSNSPWKSACPVSSSERSAMRNSRNNAIGRSYRMPKAFSTKDGAPSASPRW
jgi:hypothetical protein